MGGKLLAERHEKRAVKWARGTADLHDERHADRLQGVGQRLRSYIWEVGQDRIEAALHVEAMIGITDGGIERRQLLRMGRDGRSDRLDKPLEVGRHAAAHAERGCPARI